MQTNNLPLQLNNITGTAPRANAANAAKLSADAGQFGAMLSSEMAQAQAKMSAPAPSPAPQAPAAPKQDAAKPAQADNSARSDDTPAAQASTQDTAKSASADGAKQAGANDKADDETEDSANAAAQQPAADPASAMLALMASLQHPAARTATTPATMAQSFDALSGGAKGKLADGKQLAALQAAMKSVGKDGAGAAGDARAFAATAATKNPLDAGAALGADDKTAASGAGANAAADLSAALAGAGMKAEHKASYDAVDLSLQQARDAAQQAVQVQAPLTGALQAAQPAALEAAQAASAADELSAQVGTDAWENQVGQKVVYMIGNEEQTASLTLNPPDLGPMQVVLSVTNDQASVTFSSNQEEVRQALEDALPRLREMMSENGIALGNATVNAGMPDQRQAQQDQSSSRRGSNERRANVVGGVAAAADAPEPRVTRSAILGDRGMVDTFA